MDLLYRYRSGIAAVLLLVGTLALDWTVPPGHAAWAPYLLAVLVAHCSGGRAVLGVALLAVLLTLGRLVGLPAELRQEILADRVLGAALLGLSGVVVWAQARAAAELAREAGERRRAEAALRESEQRFRAFMDHSPALAWLKDEAGRYVYFNRTYERCLQVSQAEGFGKTDFDLFPAEVARQLQENDHAVLDGDHSVKLMESAPDARGSDRDWWVYKFLVRDGAGRRYVGGVALDMTERVRAEEAKSELIAQLRRALQEIKTLRGLIPICSYCKKIRDDAGFWQQLEQYLQRHTDAQFTHGICPECLDEQLEGLPQPPR